MNSNFLSMGNKCREFEKEFSKIQERKYSVFVNSGSSANLALIQSLINIGKLSIGDKVGFSALTWATNVMPLIQLGLTPVPIDCEIGTLNISSSKIQEVILQDDIKCLFITNVLGFSDDINLIKELCEKNNILLIEDNCESLGSELNNIKLGNFGLASTFSFFVGHHLSTIEGGMIATDSEELYHQLLMVRAHGWSRDLGNNEKIKLGNKYDVNDFYSRYTFYDLAYNLRPTEINGFIGITQIKFWDEVVEKRQNNFLYALRIMEKYNFINKLELSHMNKISNFAVPVICKNSHIADELKDKFQKNNIEIRPIISGNIYNQPFFMKYKDKDYFLPNSELIHSNGFYFGNNHNIISEEYNKIDDILQTINL